LPEILNVKIEKSQLALKLEQEKRLNFSIYQHYPFDNSYDVYACIEHTIFIKPQSKEIVPTGIYIQIDNPYYESLIISKNDMVDRGLVVMNNYMNFSYRNQVYAIIYNINDFETFIDPGNAIASIKFNQVPQVKFSYTEAIQESTIPSIGNSWVQQRKEVHQKLNRVGINPSRDEILNLIDNKGGDVEEIME